MSSRSLSERTRVTSSGVSVIGVSARRCAHSAREKTWYGDSPSSVRCSIAPCSATRSRSLLLQACLAGALRQRRLDLRERNPARLEHDQQMIDQICGFRDQPRAILGHCRERRLYRLLAELLRAIFHAAI